MLSVRHQLKRLTKAIAQSGRVRAAVCRIGAAYITLVRRTGRWETVNDELPRRLWAEGRPFVLAFWHGRLMMMPYCWDPAKRIHMLISQHRDGRLIADTVGHFGIRTVAGSTSRGGSAALRAMLKVMKHGEWVGITPDGPRGPRMRASAGIATVARLAGVPVIPVSYAAASHRRLGTWDRFVVALPFTRGVFVWGRPIAPPADPSPESLEATRQAIEDELNAITAEADRRMGCEPVPPDAPPVSATAGAAVP